MTPLRQRFVDDLRLRNYARRTIDTYVGHIAAFAKHFGRSPELLGPNEVRLNCFNGNGTTEGQGLATVSAAPKGRVPCCRPRFLSRRRCRACASFRRRSSFRDSASPRYTTAGGR
jgi:hypothetical protein